MYVSSRNFFDQMMPPQPARPALPINSDRCSPGAQCISSISPLTTINMKIVLALFGFFVAACCLPAPQILQSCDSGSNCGQNNAVLAGSRLKIKQDCRSGNCEQKNLENNGDFDAFDDFFKDDNDFGDINIQNCNSESECRQQNQGRKKRATVQVRPPKTQF